MLILKYDTTEIVPGGAGNAANNVAALGGRAALLAGDQDGVRSVVALNPWVQSTDDVDLTALRVTGQLVVSDGVATVVGSGPRLA